MIQKYTTPLSKLGTIRSSPDKLEYIHINTIKIKFSFHDNSVIEIACINGTAKIRPAIIDSFSTRGQSPIHKVLTTPKWFNVAIDLQFVL